MKILFLFCCLLSVNIALSAQRIQKADSLFESQKFTEAYNLYEEIYASGEYSDAMLLKMAFIQDGSGDYAKALIFLNQYYNKTANRLVIPKIEEIAEENNLMGYSANDIDYLLLLLDKNKRLASITLLCLIVGLCTYIYFEFRKGFISVIAMVFQVVCCLGLLMINNYSKPDQGILTTNNLLLRSGPSSAAEPIKFLNQGHKVEVLGKYSIWTKIEVEGEEGYVKNSSISII